MPIWIPLAVFAAVHLLSVYLLRASGTWNTLFGTVIDLARAPAADPLQQEDRDWIDNHEFWELHPDLDDGAEAVDDAAAFWGTRHSEAG